MPLAIFDFDGTIHRGEAMRLFLRVLRQQSDGKRRAVRRYFVRQAPAYALYRLGVCRLRMMKRAMRELVRMLIGMSQAELDAFFARCVVTAKPRFNPVCLERLRAHLAAGDRVILLSGAFAGFLALVAGELGAHHSLGTELIVEDGRCTGMARHSIGPAKVEVLRDFLAGQEETGLRFDLSEAYAYADGWQDLPVLSLVGHPVAVEPEKALRREAERRGWEVI